MPKKNLSRQESNTKSNTKSNKETKQELCKKLRKESSKEPRKESSKEPYKMEGKERLRSKSQAEMESLRQQYLPLLGRENDVTIARRAGVHIQTVRKWRRSMGIAARGNVGAKSKQWNPGNEKLLGTMPDRKLAEQIGIPSSTVSARRAALGIAPCRRRDTPLPAHLTPIDAQKIRARRRQLQLNLEAASGGHITRKSQLAKMEKGAIKAVTAETMKWLCEVLQCRPERIMPKRPRNTTV